MHLDLLLLLTTCALNVVLGGFVLMRNRKASYSVYFFIMSVCITAWAVSNYLTNYVTHIDFANIFNKAAFFTAFLAIYFGLLFTYRFPVARRSSRPGNIVVILLFILLSILSLTTVGAGEALRGDGGQVVFSTGQLLPLYVVGLLGYLFLISRNLFRSYRGARTDVKIQSIYIFVGFALTVLLGIVTNVIIPATVSNWETTRYGPMLSVILVGSITYAIVRHRLFDIKLVIVRALGYVVSLLLIALVYGLIVIAAARLFFGAEISVGVEIFFAASTAFIGLAFQPFKKVFDRATRSLFYQDAYDSQELFNALNKVLVSSLDVKYLMEKSSQIIAQNLNAEYCAVGLAKGADEYRIFGDNLPRFEVSDIQKARKITPGIHRSVIVGDSLTGTRYEVLHGIFQRNNIAVLVRLSQNERKQEEGLGYIVLGLKKSGNAYTSQDARTLESVANALIVAIQNALRFEEVEKFNITLQDKVEEATRKLRATNEKLRKLDETKDEFISMASHQLRTPLTSVKGYLSMVLEGDAGKLKPQQEALLKQSFLSSQRMVNLIADLLNLSRLNTGKFVIDASNTDLRDVVDAEIAQLQEAAKAKGIEMKYERPKEFPTLMLDENKIHQVVMNFMDNAIYYTQSEGTIDVLLTETPTAVEYRVQDTGIGVPRHMQKHLFSKFYRADNARRMRPDGTGLGIYMAKKVILAQGGSIIFESEEGKGSTFGFRFSKAAHAPAPETDKTT